MSDTPLLDQEIRNAEAMARFAVAYRDAMVTAYQKLGAGVKVMFEALEKARQDA